MSMDAVTRAIARIATGFVAASSGRTRMSGGESRTELAGQRNPVTGPLAVPRQPTGGTVYRTSVTNDVTRVTIRATPSQSAATVKTPAKDGILLAAGTWCPLRRLQEFRA